jgi:hypothetical protein
LNFIKIVRLSEKCINIFDNHQTNENLLAITKDNKKRRITTFDYSPHTNVSALNELNNQIISPILYEISDEEEENRYLLRSPPLMIAGLFHGLSTRKNASVFELTERYPIL